MQQLHDILVVFYRKVVYNVILHNVLDETQKAVHYEIGVRDPVDPFNQLVAGVFLQPSQAFAAALHHESYQVDVVL